MKTLIWHAGRRSQAIQKLEEEHFIICSSKSTIHDKGRNFKNLIIEHIGLVLQAKPIQKLDITLSIEYCCKYTIQEQKWLNKNHVWKQQNQYNKTEIWYYEILHSHLNISWMKISWDITPEPQYIMVADFVRYCTSTTISHDCITCEKLHQNPNISWLLI